MTNDILVNTIATSPIIIVGMHRSGTSLLTGLLQEAGLFCGEDLAGGHRESKYFLELNKRIFHLAHAEWDNPLPVQWLLEDTKVFQQVVVELREACRLEEMDPFFGVKDKNKKSGIVDFSLPWGWKDPRSCITLPFWLKVFPQAKVIYIVRNGVDVANSLTTRELSRKLKFSSKARSIRCASMSRSYDLWGEYHAIVSDSLSELADDRLIRIRYETLLEEPEKTLKSVADFANLSVSNDELSYISSIINTNRKNSFIKNPALCDFYKTVSADPVMIENGYQKITAVCQEAVSSCDTFPHVEVIIPTLLTDSLVSASWLDEAIKSVFDQEYSKWHITLVNDGSQANSVKRLDDWQLAYPERISVIHKHVQNGAASARMDAVLQTRAEILAFLDQDDIWDQNKLARQVEILTLNPNVGAVHTDIEIIDESSRVVEGRSQGENNKRQSINYSELNFQEMALNLFSNNSIRIISSVVRRKAFVDVGGFDRELNGGEDWEFWVRFANYYKIEYIASPLLRRRAHSANTSTTQALIRRKGQLLAIKKMVSQFPYLEFSAKTKQDAIEKVIDRLESESGCVEK